MHIEQSTSDILLFEYLSSSHPQSSAHITSNIVNNISSSQHVPITVPVSVPFLNPNTNHISNPNLQLRSPNTEDTTSQNALTLNTTPIQQHTNNIQLSLPPISTTTPLNISMNGITMNQNVHQQHNQNQNHIAAQNATNNSGIKMLNSNQYHVNAHQTQFVPATNTMNTDHVTYNIKQNQHHQVQPQIQSLPVTPPVPIKGPIMTMNEVKMMKMNNGTVNFINTRNEPSQSALPLKATVVTAAATAQPQSQTVTVGCVPVPVPIQSIPMQRGQVYYTTTPQPQNISQIPSYQIITSNKQQPMSNCTAFTTTTCNHHQQQHQQQVHVLSPGINTGQHNAFVHTPSKLVTYHHHPNNVKQMNINQNMIIPQQTMNNTRYIIHHQTNPAQNQTNGYVQTYKML